MSAKRQPRTYTFTVDDHTFTATTSRAVTHAQVVEDKDGSFGYWLTRDPRGGERSARRNGWRLVGTVTLEGSEQR